MSSMPVRIPPLGGLATYEEAARVGIGVDDSVALLRRYNRVLTRLYEISAAFINPTPEWEIKGALSLHLYLDSEHSQALRDRVAELRKPPHHMDEPLDAALEAFLNEALCAEDSVELLMGVYGVLRPTLLEACRAHQARLNPVFDFPTARVLKLIVEDQAQMVAWGAAALDAVTVQDDARRRADDWEAHLQSFLAAAGGLSGVDPLPDAPALPAARATREFVPDLDPRRDARSGDIYNFHYRADDVYQDPEADWDERNLALMFKRFHEMDVPEMMAGLILQTKGKPWEYYRDMGRQLWDEARHSMMGEVWFAKSGVDWSRYPNHVGWSLHLNLDRTPLERHVVLYYIEQSLMNGETGKRWEWLIAQKADDPLTTYFQDFDWADEVLHAQIGRRWLKPALGSVKDIMEEAARVIRLPMPTLVARRLAATQEDWWPRFVRDVLGKESTSIAGVEHAHVPRYTVGASG